MTAGLIVGTKKSRMTSDYLSLRRYRFMKRYLKMIEIYFDSLDLWSVDVQSSGISTRYKILKREDLSLI